MSDQTKALAIIPRTVDEVRTLAASFAKSSLLPEALRGKEADVFVTILAGQELGLPPMAALRGIHVIKGKPIMSADAMVAVVLGSGLARHFRCVEETDVSVTYETQRVGSPDPQRCTWTVADAKRAGLDGDNWRKYPRAMLKARCKSALARDVYPDALAGVYDETEADEIRGHTPTVVQPPSAPVIDAEIIPDAAAGLIDMIAVAESEADLRALAGDLANLTGAAKDEARRRYSARQKELRGNGKRGAAPVDDEPAGEAGA